jgi:hypothetical protein
MVGLIEVMQSFTPIVAEQAGVRNPAAFPGAQLIRFEDATCAPCHAGSQVDSMEICNCCAGVSNIRFWRLNQASGMDVPDWRRRHDRPKPFGISLICSLWLT